MQSDKFHENHSSHRITLARRYTDSAESWLRRIIHDALSKDNLSYITKGIWKSSFIKDIESKLSTNPQKYEREVDATTFDQLIDMACHPDHWDKWSSYLLEAYPNGREEARTFLTRIKSIRNDLSHGRVCSNRQLEQAACYSNDLVDSIRAHMTRISTNRDFNVPFFIKCQDSQGNSRHLSPGHFFRAVDFSAAEFRPLSPGENLIVEVEVDASFDEAEYSVIWWVKTASERGEGVVASFPIENHHVGERMELQFKLTTTADWHRGNNCDDVLDIYYRVLPPIR